MKKTIIAASFLFFVSAAVAQQQSICTQQFSDIDAGVSNSSISVAEAKGIVTDILNVMGLKGNFEIHAAAIPNAAAVIYNGKRYVLYNPSFIGKLNQVTGNDWASVSVLAHEIGHHLDGHTLGADSNAPGLELEADEFSGYIMQRLGATLQEAEMAMKLAADIRSSTTHPGRDDRLIAIEKGWNRASDQLTADIEENEKDSGDSKATAPSTTAVEPANKPVPVTSETGETIITKENIAADIEFDEDKTARYYLTVQGKMVAIKDGRLFLLGQLKEQDNQQYPYIIESKKNRLYIDIAGVIFDENGKEVGRMKEHGKT